MNAKAQSLGSAVAAYDFATSYPSRTLVRPATACKPLARVLTVKWLAQNHTSRSRKGAAVVSNCAVCAATS